VVHGAAVKPIAPVREFRVIDLNPFTLEHERILSPGAAAARQAQGQIAGHRG